MGPGKCDAVLPAAMNSFYRVKRTLMLIIGQSSAGWGGDCIASSSAARKYPTGLFHHNPVPSCEVGPVVIIATSNHCSHGNTPALEFPQHKPVPLPNTLLRYV